MSKTILVIEDERQTRSIFLNTLSLEGFAALGASGGTEGIHLAQTHGPDLIVCDIMMPDMDGYQVLSTLRQTNRTAHIPFIFLTAKASMADLRQGMTLGADDYLPKPCTVEQFLAAVDVRLQRQAELQTGPAPIEKIFPDCPALQPVFQFIDRHYCQSIRLQDIADAAGYSPAYLTTLVHQHTGHSVKQWVILRRMHQAKRDLAQTQDSIKKIAIAIGYNDPGYFCRQFRQIHGVSPQNWRLQNTPTAAQKQ